MSAQNSRDRKKEYLEQIEKQNRMLREEVARLSVQNTKKSRNAQTQEFLKVIVCLGITCFLNFGSKPLLHGSVANQVEKAVFANDKQFVKIQNEEIYRLPDSFGPLKSVSGQFEFFKKFLPLQVQESLEQFLVEPNHSDTLMNQKDQMLEHIGLLEKNNLEYLQKIRQARDKLGEKNLQGETKVHLING